MGQYLPGRGQSNASSKQKAAKAQIAINPYVLRKVSTMFFDEDGDLAHEFYTEVKSQVSGVVTWTMKRIYDNLTPQGEVDLPFSRLSADFPVVMQEALSILTPSHVHSKTYDDFF